MALRTEVIKVRAQGSQLWKHSALGQQEQRSSLGVGVRKEDT